MNRRLRAAIDRLMTPITIKIPHMPNSMVFSDCDTAPIILFLLYRAMRLRIRPPAITEAI